MSTPAEKMPGALRPGSSPPGGEDPGDAPPSDGSGDVSGQQTLHETALALMASAPLNCAGCHGEGSPLNLQSGTLEDFAERLVGQRSTTQDCAGEPLVDPDQAERSLMLRLTDARRTEPDCIAPMPLGTNGVSVEDHGTLAAWVDALIDVYRRDGGPTEPVNGAINSTDAELADAFEVVRRVKYLVVGTAVTAEELDTARDAGGALDPDAFGGLVRTWLDSPDFAAKRRTYFELALQQNPADGNYRQQLRTTNGITPGRVVDNLEASPLRTAERIYQERSDWRSLFYTTRHEVTTAMLMVLKMTDNPAMISKLGGFAKNSPINNLQQFLRANYERSSPEFDADASDWRTVNLEYDPSSEEMNTTPGFENGEYVEQMRAIRDGGTVRFRTPRVLCSLPSFFQKWQTNADNRFRVQVNQCLGMMLGSTFSAADPTTLDLHPLPGVRTSEVPEGTECMMCHKNMDVMLSAFEAHFDYEHQRFRPNSPESVEHYIAEAARALDYDPDAQGRGPRYRYESFPTPYFSYRGVNETGQDLLSLVRSTALHSGFAIGQTLKVCQWVSSVRCDRSDPEVIRVAEAFAASGYRLDKLFEAFFTSKLTTHTYTEEESAYPGAQVSVARRGHYCHAIRVRLREVRRARGLDNITRDTDLCGDNRKLSEGIPVGTNLRGETDFNLPRLSSPFSGISISNLCNSGLDQIVGNGNQTFRRNEATANDTIGLMVSHMLGFPEGTSQHDTAASALQAVYGVFRASSPTCADTAAFEAALSSGAEASCGLGLSEQAAMENIFSLVCQDPALTTVGL